MRQKGLTVRQAAEMYVRELDAIQTGMIKKLMNIDPDDWTEVTKPSTGDRVYVYDESADGEVVKVSEDKYIVRLDPNGKEVAYSEDDFEVEYETRLPMWSTMWSAHDPCDVWWLEEGDGVKALSECGFRVYYSEEFGYFFGIDGAGYDFYEAHWCPLYRKHGLQWHDPAAEQAEQMTCKGYKKGRLSNREYWFDKDGVAIAEVLE